MDDTALSFESLEYPAAESPDWGFARNTRCALIAPSAEWVQSTCSFRFELNGRNFIAPNRDYPYEGLMVYLGGENWKMLDCVAVSLAGTDGRPLLMAGSSVRVNPWRVDYLYTVSARDSEADVGAPLVVSYYIGSDSPPEVVTGSVEIYFEGEPLAEAGEIVAWVQPFVDIRHMYSSSAFDSYRVSADFQGEKCIQISAGDRALTFYVPGGEPSVFGGPEILSWRYKLGTGSRVEAEGNDRRKQTVFTGEQKNVAAFFGVRSGALRAREPFKLFFCVHRADRPARLPLAEVADRLGRSEKSERDELRLIAGAFPLRAGRELREAIWGRIVGLTKFKTNIFCTKTESYIRAPHAGAWWFKTPWYRDVFEVTLNSLNTLMRIPKERENVKEVIGLALRYQDGETGLVLNKIPEFTTLESQHNSSDATLLCYTAANRYIRETKDTDFAVEVMSYARHTLACFGRGAGGPARPLEADGPPRIDEQTGLLLSAPQHSWIDTRTLCVEYAGWRLEGLPNRFSVKFAKDLYDLLGDKAPVEALSSSPSFFLPEINAQWIMMLSGTLATLGLIGREAPAGSRPGWVEEFAASVQALLDRAVDHFKPVFWNPAGGCLYNLVLADGAARDEMECEAAVTAAAMLGEAIFTRGELAAVWDCARERLLVRRRLVKYGDGFLPFGIKTKNEDSRIFYGDAQYHSDTVWPRSTPYLIRLLRLLGEEATIREILVNNLDHQMTECALFYNQELFSRPSGNNRHPVEATSRNPVPVKNPIQLWSQWCDAYVEAFCEEE